MTERNVYTAQQSLGGKWNVWRERNDVSLMADSLTRAQATAIAAVLNLLDELEHFAEPIDPNPTCGSDENAPEPVNFRHPHEKRFRGLVQPPKECPNCAKVEHYGRPECKECGAILP